MTIDITPNKSGPIPEWDGIEEFRKSLEEAAKEMEKLFGPFMKKK